MKRETVMEALNNWDSDNIVIHICLKHGVASHGGYSESSIQVELPRKDIRPMDDYLILRDLCWQEAGSYSSSKKFYSKLGVTVGESKLNIAYIEYEDILFIGREGL